MAGIFLSYRRHDSQEVAGRIYDYLCANFPRDTIFKDVDSIPAGENFPRFIQRTIREAGVCLVLIGPEFLTIRNDRGKRRLDDSKDPFRIEIETALALRKPILPLTVSGGRMPSPRDLPPSLRPLTERNAIDIHPDPDFRHHIGRVVEAIRRILRRRDTGLLSEEEIAARVAALQPEHWRREYGLTEVRSSFHGFDFETLIAAPRELLIVMNDGRTWIDSHRESLAERIASKSKTTQVLFLHPRSKFIPTLLEKNGKSLAMQLGELRRSLLVLEAARRSWSRLEVRGHHAFNPYSLYVTEREAVMSPYLLQESGALPLFVFARDAKDPIYERLRKDAVAAFAAAALLTSRDVPG